MKPVREESDLLEELVADRAKSDPEVLRKWAAVKLVQDICAIRIRKGLPLAEIAIKMAIPQSRVASIERRPWSASLVHIMAYAQAVGADVNVSEAVETQISA